ncbi:hypothetical protein [Novosphingobium colocasiae]|uniref:hypothetical protein n=1 Tax=Novosphingobium colocasiae TaxID=1256513 RepID=UPI001675F246|nr:hypothetical protein [Novosphingobium colocasiae]
MNAPNRFDTGRALLLAVWVVLVGYLSIHHVFWRDEVRALSFAIQGDDLAQMFAKVRGDGHPLVWFLILRAGHAVIGSAILPVAAHAIAFASVVLLLWRSPFSLPTLALMVVSHVIAWEYAVMARNYGISMLLMFAFAALYPQWRARGLWLCVPLALLANTNAHSAALAWLLYGAWMLDRWQGWPLWRTWMLRLALPGAVLLGLATLACFLSIWPSINDAATFARPITLARIARAVLLPGAEFTLIDDAPLSLALGATALLAGCTLVLWGRPHYLLAAIGGLCALSLLFAVVYPASNRHRDLWLVFLIALAWMRLDADRTGDGPPAPLRRIGQWAFHALLAFQALMTVSEIQSAMARPEIPRSRAKELAALLASRPDLAGAIVIADPDNMIETLPYYAPRTPVWRIRQGGYSAIDIFTSHGATLNLTLDDILTTARRLHACTGRPVAILMQRPPRPGEDVTVPSVYNWTTLITPAMTQRFLAQTSRIARFGPAETDESYAVYRYVPSSGSAAPGDCAAMRVPATSAAAGWRQP